MHTQEVDVDGTTYYVHHNGDWSGDALVAWKDATGTHEVKLPAKLFTVCSNNAVLDDVVSAVERLYVDAQGRRDR